jgi:hypothetical protein
MIDTIRTNMYVDANSINEHTNKLMNAVIKKHYNRQFDQDYSLYL